MKKICLLLVLVSSVFAQSYEEFLQSQKQDFSSFKEERDKAFSKFLNEEWKAFKASNSKSSYVKKKPKTLPQAPIEKTHYLKTPTHTKEVHLPLIIEKRQGKSYSKIIISPAQAKEKTLYINYFGVKVQFNYDKSMLFTMDNKIDKDDIASAWDSLARSKYEQSIKELQAISLKLHLNAWAQYLLVQKVSNSLFRDDNEAKVFSWFALLKMGYDAHIAYQSNKVVLLLPVKGELFNTVYYTFNKKKYYAIDYYAKGKVGTIMTYENTYEGSTKSLDFSLEVLPSFAQVKVDKTLVFKIQNKPTYVTLSYNKNILSFLQSYPQVSYENYFKSPSSSLFENSLRRSFKPLLEGKNEIEAIGIILNFVQNAFKYKVDVEQFNREKVMFAQESIYYPYSDCEDRAILFSYMVKYLLNLDVLGLKYPNHMATAVLIKDKIKGDYVSLNHKEYIVADPTYVNAALGMSMPKFKGSKAYTIVLTGGEK